jgi:hypothetical protein
MPTPPRHADAAPVMPTKVGIHDCADCVRVKAWMPTFVGMTGAVRLSSYRRPGMFAVSKNTPTMAGVGWVR